MDISKLSSKGQVTIPIDIRRRLGLHEGENVIFLEKYGGVIITSENELHTFISDKSSQESNTGSTLFEGSMNQAIIEPMNTASKKERLKIVRSLFGSINDSTITEPPEVQYESQKEWELMDQ